MFARGQLIAINDALKTLTAPKKDQTVQQKLDTILQGKFSSGMAKAAAAQFQD